MLFFHGKRPVICHSKLKRGATLFLFEFIDELLFALIAVLTADFVDRIVGIQKRLFHEFDASLVDIFENGQTVMRFEQPFEIALRDSYVFCDRIDGNARVEIVPNKIDRFTDMPHARIFLRVAFVAFDCFEEGAVGVAFHDLRIVTFRIH